MSGDAVLSAAVFVRDASYHCLSTIRSLLECRTVGPIAVGSADPSLLDALAVHDRVHTFEVASAAALVNRAVDNWGLPVAACDEPVLIDPASLDALAAHLDADLRIAVVCAFSNSGGYLTFPERNAVEPPRAGNVDLQSVSARLAELRPGLGWVPVPLAQGPLTVINTVAVDAIGPLVESPFGVLDVSLAEFGQRAARRGLLTVLDPTVYIARPFDLAPAPADAISRSDVRSWLAVHHPFFAATYDHDRNSQESPLGIAHAVARSKVLGLTVLIDGSCLGALEMGTQVNLVAYVRALAARDDVREVVVSIPGPVPAYATSSFASAKIRTVRHPRGEFPPEVRGDVVHRTFQPDTPLPLANWHRAARRVAVTLQDLIAYRNGSYHPDAKHWMKYRYELAKAASQADMVATISHDAARAVREEQLNIDADRLFPIALGTDHLTGDEPARPPSVALEHGLAAREFLVVLGTNYSHKNRDLALRAWQIVRSRGHDVGLVIVGAAVPYGSSRHHESEAYLDGEQAVNLPDVTSEERNWLLRHAVAAVYPTSAEGFGFVPFEAARFGTPTVAVNFGPLREVGAESEALARSWSPEHLADAVERLLRNPGLRDDAVRQTLAAGDQYTWAHTAAFLVDAYRAVLGLPRRT